MWWIKLFVLVLVQALALVSADASRVLRQPEGPTGHPSCTDGIDNDKDGTTDNCVGTGAAWSTCTGGYCAEFTQGRPVGELATVIDASNGNYLHVPLSGSEFSSQVGLCTHGGPSLANGTYYLHLFAALETPAMPWVWISLDTPWDVAAGPPYLIFPDTNVNASLLFNGLAQPIPAWDFASAANSNGNFLQRVAGVDPRTFALNGHHCLYFLPQRGVKLWAAYLSTNQSQQPQRGGPATTVEYTVFELGANTISINGACSESAWGNANVVPFTGFNNSDNTITLKLLWDNTTTDRLYGCATIADTDLRATTTANDDAGVFGDDGLEFVHTDDLTPIFDNTTFKTAINCRTTPAALTRNYPSGIEDNAYNPSLSASASLNGTLDDTANDTSCTLEFAMNLGYDAAPDQLILANFRNNDRDVTQTRRDAKGTGDVGNLLQAMVLKLSGTTVPDPPPDTTPPSVGTVAMSGIGTASGVATFTSNEDGACAIRYDLDNDNAVAGGDVVEILGGVVSGGQCQVNVSGLAAETAYEIVGRVTDGAGLVGTSVGVTDFTTTGAGAEFFVSPTGGGSTCSAASPCALSRLSSASEPKPSPGETWIVNDGTYTSGLPSIDCNGGASNGSASQPIIIRAANERQALLQSNGGTALFMADCAYWTIEGLRLQSADHTSNVGNGIAEIWRSTNIVFKKNLLSTANRYTNMHGMYMDNMKFSLLEENELYWVHRHGFITRTTGPGQNVYRRNYVNSRMLPDVSGGQVTDGSGADLCMTTYSSPGNIFENNIVEGCNTGFGSMSVSGQSSYGNRFYGNISLGHPGGASGDMNSGLCLGCPGADYDVLTVDEAVEHHLVRYVGCSGISMYGTNLQVRNSTAIGWTAAGIGCEMAGLISGIHGYALSPFAGASLTWSNVLSMNTGGPGFQVGETPSAVLNSPAAFNNVGGSFSTGGATINSPFTGNPGMGSCMAWIPGGSPLKNTGTGEMLASGASAADRGANILYRYQNGALTGTPLWNTDSTPRFPCGAVIGGVNDISGSSCFDVHQRLAVGTANGCLLPY